MATSDAIIQLRELVGDATIAMLTSATPSGGLHSRPLTLGEIDDHGNLVFLVDGDADWVRGLKFGEQVNVSLADHDERTWISVAGNASISGDRATIDRLWSPAAELFFPEGKDSPRLRVLEVRAGTVEYWDAPSSRLKMLALAAGAKLGRADGRAGDSGSIDLS